METSVQAFLDEVLNDPFGSAFANATSTATDVIGGWQTPDSGHRTFDAVFDGGDEGDGEGAAVSAGRDKGEELNGRSGMETQNLPDMHDGRQVVDLLDSERTTSKTSFTSAMVDESKDGVEKQPGDEQRGVKAQKELREQDLSVPLSAPQAHKTHNRLQTEVTDTPDEPLAAASPSTPPVLPPITRTSPQVRQSSASRYRIPRPTTQSDVDGVSRDGSMQKAASLLQSRPASARSTSPTPSRAASARLKLRNQGQEERHISKRFSLTRLLDTPGTTPSSATRSDLGTRMLEQSSQASRQLLSRRLQTYTRPITSEPTKSALPHSTSPPYTMRTSRTGSGTVPTSFSAAARTAAPRQHQRCKKHPPREGTSQHRYMVQRQQAKALHSTGSSSWVQDIERELDRKLAAINAQVLRKDMQLVQQSKALSRHLHVDEHHPLQFKRLVPHIQALQSVVERFPRPLALSLEPVIHGYLDLIECEIEHVVPPGNECRGLDDRRITEDSPLGTVMTTPAIVKRFEMRHGTTIPAALETFDECVRSVVINAKKSSLAPKATMRKLQTTKKRLKKSIETILEQVAVEHARIQQYKQDTLAASLRADHQLSLIKRGQRSVDEIESNNGDKLQAIYAEILTIERQMAKITELRQTECVPRQVVEWVEDSTRQAENDCTRWQKQIDLLKTDLITARSQLATLQRKSTDISSNA
eukprot:m.281717 g.281717  ORF g.281717 m.281717 type:complete len:700 (+) comp15754_c0_seq1:94-2193(+)